MIKFDETFWRDVLIAVLSSIVLYFILQKTLRLKG